MAQSLVETQAARTMIGESGDLLAEIQHELSHVLTSTSHALLAGKNDAATAR